MEQNELFEGVGWIGVDLDGTLAEIGDWQGLQFIGKPIKLMVDRVKDWISQGYTVKIFTARVSHKDPKLNELAEWHIKQWSKKNIGSALEVTCKKDFNMTTLYDDRCVTVIHNTGLFAHEITSIN